MRVKYCPLPKFVNLFTILAIQFDDCCAYTKIIQLTPLWGVN